MAQITRKLFHQEDDEKLKSVVQELGEDNWNEVSERMKIFTPRQCKERYTIYLKHEYRTDPWTDEEDALLIELYDRIGPKWREISEFFNERHVNSVKNRWYRYIQNGSKKSIEKYEQECFLRNEKEKMRRERKNQQLNKQAQISPSAPDPTTIEESKPIIGQLETLPTVDSTVDPDANQQSTKKYRNEFDIAAEPKMDDLKFDFILNDFLYK